MSDEFNSRIEAIEARNGRVAADKAWETSLTRRFTIALITWACAGFYMAAFLGDALWYLGALVPVLGYLLSTLSLPFIRRVWQNHA